jgi:tetratricopeptide (TPR) repeat protein
MGTVLWISRDGGIAGSITAVNRKVNVGAMTAQESCELFQRLSGQDDAELSLDEEKLLLEMLELIERLPLAIVQAASYIRKTKVSIKKYLEFYNESESRRSNLLHLEYQDAYQSEVPKSVLHTWLISMRQIAKESPCSEMILGTLAFVDNSGIPFNLVKAAAGPEYNMDEVLLSAGRLMDYSFIQEHDAGRKDFPDYKMHRLVQLAARQSLSATQTFAFSGAALRIMDILFPNGSYETWDGCRLYLAHALKAIEWEYADDYNFRASQLLQSIGRYYRAQGRSNEAEEVHVKALKLLEDMFGNKDPGITNAMLGLAETWSRQGRYKEAEEREVKVLQLLRARGEPGWTHPYMIVAKSNLAMTWDRLGRLDDAEELRREVVEQLKESHGENKRDAMTIAAMGNLAASWQEQGKLLAAEDLAREVYELSKEELGERHPGTIKAMASLAQTWHYQGRLDEAAKLQATVLNLYTDIMGKKHPETIKVMGNLAATWSDQGQLDEAEKLNIKVLQLLKELLGEKHPATIHAMAALAATWTLLKRFDEAERLGIDVLELHKEVLGEKHPATIVALANLAATISQQQDRSTEAEEYEIEVLRLQTEVLGDKHPNTITAMANLVVTYLQRGKSDEAKELQVKVVELRREVLGSAHPHTEKAAEGLAQINEVLFPNNGEVKPHSIPSNGLNTSDFVQQGTTGKRSSSRRKIWKGKFSKWRKSDDS